MSLVPMIGFVTIFPGVSLTLVHIPVLIGVFLLPKRYSWLLGLFFGIGSLIAAALYAATPFDYAFIYPWISILPRVLFVIGASYIFDFFKWLFEKYKKARIYSFGLITLITIFAIFFGVKAITHNVAWSDYSNTSGQIASIENELENNEELTALDIIDLNAEKLSLEVLLIDLENEAVEAEANYTKVTVPLSLILSTVFISIYFTFIINNKEEYNTYPSAIILSTLLHTLLVLSTIVLFRPALFYQTFGTNDSVITILFSIAAANGLIEALVATFVGTPIIIGLKNLSKKY
jgi:uncharacterized membrane protein